MIHYMEPASDDNANSTSIKIGRLPCVVMLWFAIHPDEELTTEDISLKFDAQMHNLVARLEMLVRTEVLIKKKVGLNGKSTNIYSTGPTLLDMLNRRAMEE